MQKVLDRIAKASKVQTKLNKANKPARNRKVELNLAQDLEDLASTMRNAMNGISVDIASEVSDFNNSVSALQNAIGQYKQLEVALNNFFEVKDEFDSAAESLGIEPSDDKYDSLINEVADTFDKANDAIVDLEEGANTALRLSNEMPIPFM